jgi:hypothetical protein
MYVFEWLGSWWDLVESGNDCQPYIPQFLLVDYVEYQFATCGLDPVIAAYALLHFSDCVGLRRSCRGDSNRVRCAVERRDPGKE